MRIIFMGTPDFGESAFMKLMESRHQVIAVYTQKPKQAGRGMKVIKSRIHELAEKFHIDVFTPDNFKSEKDIDAFTNLHADVAVVAAYGLLLPLEILQGTRKGCINIHPSLLPRWRGAAPLQRSLMAGDKVNGVCIMKMNEGLDSGDVILKEEFDVPADADAEWLHNKCANLGAELLLQTLDLMNEGKEKYTPQQEKGLVYAKKINKDDEKLDFNKNGDEIINQIRALSPYPGANFNLEGLKYKIFKAEFQPSEANSIALDDLKEPGTILNEKLHIKCKNGFIVPKIVQKEGKSRMDIESFLKGNKIEPNKIIT